jgi:hypothetical protein
MYLQVDYAQGKSDRGYIFYNRTEMRVHFSYDSRAGTPDYVRKWLFFNEVHMRYLFPFAKCILEEIIYSR